MKKILFGLCLLMFIFSSCEKEVSLENGNNIGAAGDFRADIDGISWVANSVSRATRAGGFITLYGKDFNNKTITMIVKDSGVHSYSFSSTSTTNVGIYEDSSITPVAAWSTTQWLAPGIYGDMNITEIDTVRKLLTGTFTINVYRSIDDQTKAITNGVFIKIPYTQTVVAPPVADTFRVKVDGTQYSYSSIALNSVGANFSITAAQGTGTSSVNLILGNLPAGTYTIGGTDYIGFYAMGANVFTATTGTLTILENNTTTRRVRANFDFTGTSGTPPDAVLTEGYFSMSY